LAANSLTSEEQPLLAATIDPENYKLACGVDLPASFTFGFQDVQVVKTLSTMNTPPTALKFASGKDLLVGTYGGTILNWDMQQNKGKVSVLV